jgi:hypothetical protein
VQRIDEPDADLILENSEDEIEDGAAD